MKKYMLLLIMMLFVANGANALFVEGLEDVPLYEGLEQNEDEHISFGNEGGRFVDGVYEGKGIELAEVMSFYQTSLPALGWVLVEETANRISFEREGELLEIICESKNPFRLRITVKSKN